MTSEYRRPDYMAAYEWDRICELLPNHMISGIYNYLQNGYAPGSFMTAILQNDFVHAAMKADDLNKSYFFEYARVLHDYFPYLSWGSKAFVAAWSEHRQKEMAKQAPTSEDDTNVVDMTMHNMERK